MQSNKGRNTGPERELKMLLRKNGLVGYRTNYKHAAGRPDVAFPAKRLAVFVHGCFWHRCPKCRPTLPKTHRSYWRRKFQLNRARDRRQEKALAATGWRTVVIWECFLEAMNSARLGTALRTIRRIYDRPSNSAHPWKKKPREI